MRLPWVDGLDFPPLSQALTEPNGLLAASEALTSEQVEAAYRRGIFPWYNPGEPVLWWSPDPRMVLYTAEFRHHRSIRQSHKQHSFRITLDTAFAQVIEHCATVRGEGHTWITEDIRAAYTALHARGLAHSAETWQGDRLVGGLYGVAIGKMFFGESMFALSRDASKCALARLVSQLARWKFLMIDCQQETEHLANLGARPISREDFIATVTKLIDLPSVNSPWALDPDLA